MESELAMESEPTPSSDATTTEPPPEKRPKLEQSLPWPPASPTVAAAPPTPAAAATTSTSGAPPPPVVKPPNGGFLVPYTIRKSSIAGHGIFAAAPIKRGALIWRYAVGVSIAEHDERSLRQRIKPLAKKDAIDLLEHVYVWNSLVIEILDDAKIWNHFHKPNTGNHPDGDAVGDGMSSYALRDIKAGEELTDDYALHDHLPWFEKLCIDTGAISCTSLGRSENAWANPQIYDPPAEPEIYGESKGGTSSTF